MNKNSQFRRRMRPAVWAALSTVLRPTTRWRVLPDYLIIGAQRSGTTSLQQLLCAHPNITSARLMKGVHYFDTAYHKGSDWYRLQFPTTAYARLLEGRTGAPLRVGEASPYYIFHPLALDRIHNDLPGVKLIAILRDPVERAISHHKHEVRRENEPLELQAALEAEASRLEGEAERIVRNQPGYNSKAHQTFSYVARGHYIKEVRSMLESFGRDRVLILSSEQLFSDPGPACSRIFEFLEVPPWVPDGFPHMNPTADTSVPESVRKYLADAYAESNAELFALLGERFPWQ
ncbi:MAG: sulfotransferase domain-containing protein [bacterium]|nr:sulfotransferase domain-containing protein [bacterium]